MIVKFYKCSDDSRTLNKNISFIQQADCRLKGETNLLNPVIEVASPVINSNYVYIPELSRYYYVNNMELLGNNLLRLYLHIDVLMSHRNAIKNINTMVVRQELDYNPYIIDDEMLTRCDRTQVVELFPNDPFPESGYKYVITTVGYA